MNAEQDRNESLSRELFKAFTDLDFWPTNERETAFGHLTMLHMQDRPPQNLKRRQDERDEYLDDVTVDFLKQYEEKLWPAKKAERQHRARPEVNRKPRSFIYSIDGGSKKVHDGHLYDTMLESAIGKAMREYFGLLLRMSEVQKLEPESFEDVQLRRVLAPDRAIRYGSPGQDSYSVSRVLA